MDTYRIVLFIHVLMAVVTFGVSAIMHLSMFELRKAATVGEARAAALRISTLEPFFPIAALGLFLAGGYLVHEAFKWTTGWVICAIIGLVIIEGLGGTILKKATKNLHDAVMSAEVNEPLTPQIRELSTSREVWITAHVATGLAIGILFLMTNQPTSIIGALVILLAFAAAAVASAIPFTVAPESKSSGPTATEINS